ncbi:MAG: hypothetical protein JXB04_11500, partial [Kiritimatiellae bacterium]|nr:hypothetical protein [Kiritimatiellia bacterium]
MKKLYLVLGISLVLASGAWAQNLITNGTFDVPDINFGDEDPAVHWADTGWTHWGNVFRERWAAHSGHAGGFFKGWWSGDGGLYQDIPCTGGQHTFTAWVRREPAFHSLSNLEIKLEWIDSTGTNWVDTTVYGYYNTFPDDALWHQIHVTATGTDPNIVFIRPVIYCNWGTAGGSLAFDDMEIYPGPYTGAPPRLQNRSFEFYTTNGLRGTQWAGYPEWYEDWGPGNEAPWEMNTNWAARSGQNGVAFKGWLSYTNQFHMKLYQNFNPGTGTFTFAVWMRRESGFLMTNAGIRLDWYDGTFTNIISDGVSSNFIVPGDNTNWYEYFVTGTCTSDAIQEARVQVF